MAEPRCSRLAGMTDSPPDGGDARGPDECTTRWDRWVLLILGIITVVGILPRVVALGGPSFWNDEAASSLFALAALKSGLPVLPHDPAAIRLVNFDPLYAEIEAAAFWAGGPGQFTARLPAMVFGVLAVPASYLLGRRLANSYVGIALALMVATSSEYIAWSRQARGYSLFTLLLILIAVVLLVRPRFRFLLPRWRFLTVLAVLLALAVLASPGLFLVYLPAALVGVVAYYALRHRRSVLGWFGLPAPEAEAPNPSLLRSVWTRRLLPVVLLAAVALLWLFPPPALAGAADSAFRALFGYAPYRFTPISKFGTYLFSYYALVTYPALVGGVVVLADRRETEWALLAFFLAALVTLSTVLSYAINASGGAPIYERYLTPLLVFLFYFAARGIRYLVTLAWNGARSLRNSRLPRAQRRALFAVGVAALLIVPGVLIPTGLNTYALSNFSPTGSLVPWVPFSPWPKDPSALFMTPQPNFERAAAYVAGHRSPGDAVMAIWPEAPTFYLGSVAYWIYQHPPPGSAVPVPGGFAYYLTGSRLVANVTALTTVLNASAGWLLLDTNAIGALGPNLTFAVEAFLQPIPPASDVSISVYHWNQSADPGQLVALEERRGDLRLAFGDNLTALVNWAAVYGVTSDLDRALVLPLEPYLLGQCSLGVRPLAVLVDLYNQRPDLRSAFPEVLAGNFTGLLGWAADVTSGQIADSAAPELAPYAAYYAAASSGAAG